MFQLNVEQEDMLIAAQIEMEQHYTRDNCRKAVLKELETDIAIEALINTCRNNIMKWCDEEHYESKARMLTQLKEMEEKSDNTLIAKMLTNILVEILLGGRIQDFTAAVGRGLCYLPWTRDDENEPLLLKRMGEFLTHMCDGNLFDIVFPYDSESGMLTIVHNWALEDETVEQIALSKFMPPMITKPKQVKSLRDSPYQTVKSKSMSKWWNQGHKGDLRYDYLNKRNATPFKLDIPYLMVCEDVMDFSEEEHEDTEWSADVEVKEEQWKQFQIDTNEIASRIHNKSMRAGGNGDIYFGHFYDNRMRTYCTGYHISYQGNSHRKAMLNFSEECAVDGVNELKGFFTEAPIELEEVIEPIVETIEPTIEIESVVVESVMIELADDDDDDMIILI